MATSPPDDLGPESRRMSMRRARSGGSSAGFSRGVSTSTESYRGDDEPVIDSDLNEAVFERAATVPPPVGPAGDPGDDNRRRMAEVAMAGSSTYAKEHRLHLLHRLLMRQVPLDLIARELGVSISTVEKDRIELKRRLRESAQQLNINEIVGTQGAFYDDVRSMSLRLASAQATPTAMKLAAMRTALAAEADRSRFLTNAGVFDVLAFRRAEDGSDISDVQLLMQQATELIENIERAEVEEAKPRDPLRRPAPKPGGFKRLAFDNKEGSSGDDEVEEL